MKHNQKTKTQKTKKNNTLKKKISQYFCETKEQDICCETDYNRKEIVEKIMTMYKEIFNNTEDNYLDWIDNDIVGFIGVRNFLQNDKNFKGVKMWNFLASKTKNKENIHQTLMELPLYYLLAFLGSTYLNYTNFLKNK